MLRKSQITVKLAGKRQSMKRSPETGKVILIVIGFAGNAEKLLDARRATKDY